MTSMKPLILVDVGNIAWRSHFAHKSLSYDGHPTGVVHGFLQAIHSLRKRSDRLVFCWDLGVPGDRFVPHFRRQIDPSYKVSRHHNPDDLQAVLSQFEEIYHVLGWLGYPSAAVPGWEADDVMGLLSTQEPGDVVLYSSDSDLCQLLNERVSIRTPGKEGKIVMAKSIEQEYGFPVSRWMDYLALGGDSADGYTVQGMGPQTARKLVLAGAEAELPFDEQQQEVYKSFKRWEPMWPQVNTAFQLAKIRTDLPAGCEIRQSLPPGWYSPEHREWSLDQFSTFCADHGMAQAFADRKKFFASQEDQSEIAGDRHK